MNKRMILFSGVFMLCGGASICAVAGPSTKGPAQVSPSTMTPTQIPGPAQAFRPKSEFWDLAVDHFIVNGVQFPFLNDFHQAKVINLQVGQSVHCQCFYKLKTVNLGTITQADVTTWGAGNSYLIAGGLFFPGPPSHQEYKTETRQTPKFAFADVQSWKNQYGSSGKKEWSETMTYNWTAAQEHVGKALYLHFSLDSFMKIKETDEQNNGNASSSGVVAKFVVSQ